MQMTILHIESNYQPTWAKNSGDSSTAAAVKLKAAPLGTRQLILMASFSGSESLNAHGEYQKMLVCMSQGCGVCLCMAQWVRHTRIRGRRSALYPLSIAIRLQVSMTTTCASFSTDQEAVCFSHILIFRLIRARHGLVR